MLFIYDMGPATDLKVSGLSYLSTQHGWVMDNVVD